MKITCPNCASSYTVADDMLGPLGRKVKCATCATIWHAKPDEASEPPVIEEDGATDNSQDDIDALFGSGADNDASDGVDNSQDDIDALFGSDAPADDKSDNNQDDIDALFGPNGSETAGDDNNQDDIDALFGSAAASKASVAPSSRESKIDAVSGKATQASRTVASGPVGAVSRPSETIEAGTAPETHKKRKAGKPRVRLKKDRSGLGEISQMVRNTGRVAKPALVAAGLIAIALAIPFRDSVVRTFPDLASLYTMAGLGVNVRGVTLSDFTAERQRVAGLSVLRIDGVITNPGDDEKPLSALRLALVAEDGAELFVWSLEPGADTLASGQTLPVVSELTAAPENVARVTVRFLRAGERV